MLATWIFSNHNLLVGVWPCLDLMAIGWSRMTVAKVYDGLAIS